MVEQHGKTLVPQIRFAGFTDPWEQRKLGEIAEVVGGGTPSTDIESYWDGDIDWYSPAELGDAVYADSSVRKITLSGYQSCSATMLPAGKTILFTSRAGIGNTAILRRSGCTNQGFQSLVINDETDVYFVYSMSGQIKKYAEQKASGSTFLEISGKALAAGRFAFPSLDEQRLIGAFFDRLDSLITLHQRKYDKLCVLKKSMLDKMFPKGGSLYPEIRFAGFTDPWEQRKLSELVEIERGGSPRPIERYITDDPCGLNWVKIGDAPELGRYITQTTEKIKPEGLAKTRQVYPGDLVLSNSMSFGRPYIMAIRGCIHDGWLLIRDAQKHFDPIFLCHMLGAPQMLNQYRMFAAGSTVNNLNKELVGKAIVSLPSKDEQREIGIVLDRLDSLITLHQRKYDGCANPLFLERRISCRKPSHQNRCSATTTPSG